MKRLTAALVVMALAAPALGDKPKVDVRFVIEAQEFIDGLGKARTTVERALTALLLERCRANQGFPFIDWVNDAQMSNHLIVALVQRKAGAGFETLIEYRAATKAGSTPLDIEDRVYRWFDPKNADISDAVRPWLEKKIRAEFDDDGFRKKLMERFVSQIPLAEHVDLDNASHRVLVPVAKLSAGEQSELGVSFFGKSDGRPGAMTLRQPQEYPQGGGVLCQIKEFNFGGLPPLAGDWSERIPQLFGPTKVRDVRVTMVHFVYKYQAPDSSQGRVMNP